MSLKGFHVFFIGTCVLLSTFVTVWAMAHAEWVMAFAAVSGGTVLVAYGEAFLEKTQALGLR